MRYSGASLGYQLAGVAGGALAPIIATALLAAYDSSLAVSLYVALALVVTLVALAVARESAGEDLEEAAAEEEARLVRDREEPGSRRCARRDGAGRPASAWTSAGRSPTSSRSSTAAW